MPYKFNGKEFDEETGLYYYGARYMNPVASIWYGIDQLTEKYPHMGGYVYCYGNPIRLVDPDGNDPATAIVEGINAFVTSVGVDFLYHYVFNGENFNQALKNVNYKEATISAIQTSLMSAFIPSSGTKVFMAKILKTKAGRACFDFAKKFASNLRQTIVNKYYAGEFDDENGNFDISKLNGTSIKKIIASSFASTISDKAFGKFFGKRISAANDKYKKAFDSVSEQMEKYTQSLKKAGLNPNITNTLERRAAKINAEKSKELKALMNVAKWDMFNKTSSEISSKAGEASIKK